MIQLMKHLCVTDLVGVWMNRGVLLLMIELLLGWSSIIIRQLYNNNDNCDAGMHHDG